MKRQKHPTQVRDSELVDAGPHAARLEVERWRVAFARDAVVARLLSLSALLEAEVDALEEQAARAKASSPVAASPPPAAPPAGPEQPATPAHPAPAPASASEGKREVALLSGHIEEGMLADILQMISANGKTGLFRVVGEDVQADIWFDSGEVVHAASANVSGEDAFYAALAQTTGKFTFQESATVAVQRTISSKTQFLILEGLRRIDEEGQAVEEGG